METKEKEGKINGVTGRFLGLVTWPEDHPLARVRGRIANQQWKATRPIDGYGTNGSIAVCIRHDDNCKNGHETFSITANVYTDESRRQRDIAAGGCMHDEIIRVFPELAPLVKWHLCSTNGPMHYLDNTLFLAEDRDCWGLLKDERRQIRNGKTGVLAWRLALVDATGAEVKPPQYIDADTQPTSPATAVYIPWERIGEGKARELDAARNVAVWPEATDAQLCAPKDELRAMLEARLPALIADFRRDVEACGFVWSGIEK